MTPGIEAKIDELVRDMRRVVANTDAIRVEVQRLAKRVAVLESDPPPKNGEAA